MFYTESERLASIICADVCVNSYFHVFPGGYLVFRHHGD